jgi:hypothetical protein
MIAIYKKMEEEVTWIMDWRNDIKRQKLFMGN